MNPTKKRGKEKHIKLVVLEDPDKPIAFKKKTTCDFIGLY